MGTGSPHRKSPHTGQGGQEELKKLTQWQTNLQSYDEEDRHPKTLRQRTLSMMETHKMGMGNPHTENPHTGQGNQEELVRTLAEN